MKIFVKVKPNAKVATIERRDENHFLISVKEKPKGNEANFAVIKALSEYFQVSLSAVRMLSGAHGRQKIFEIMGL